MITYNPDLKIFYSTLINDKQYFSGFSTRELGDARKTDNIETFLKNSGLNYTNLIVLSQIHSTNISVFDDFDLGEKFIRLEDTDGIITANTGVVLTIRNADCVPLLFVDKVNSLIGISHQGWRGSLKKMAAKMVKSFIDHGSKVANITCSIGPSIGACCYNIEEERYYSFREEFDGYSEKIFSRRKGDWFLNLALLNYLQLIDSGVKKENIDFFPFCTKCDKKRFFSRRRSKSNDFEEMFNFVVKLS